MKQVINRLLEVGVSGSALGILLANLTDVATPSAETRGLVVYAWYWESHAHPGKADWTYDDGVIILDGCRYRAIHKSEAAEAYKVEIEDNMKLVNVDFLSNMTGVDVSIMRGLRDSRENEVIGTLIKGSCGWDALIDALLESEGTGGRQHALDVEGVESVYRDWFIYQLD
jgi:hypothetical protein